MEDVFRHAVHLFQARRFAESERLCVKLLDANPDDPDSHHLMAAIAQEAGRNSVSLDFIDRALAIGADRGEFHYTRGNGLVGLGRLIEAAQSYLQALALTQDYPEAHHNLCGIVQDLCSEERDGEARIIVRAWFDNHPNNATARHFAGALGLTEPPSAASLDFIRDYFDMWADIYDETMAAQKYRGSVQLSRAVADAYGQPRGKLDVLDAGCGTGLLAAELEPYARILTGLDVSPRMLEHAARREAYDRLCENDLASFTKGGAQKFDLIVAAGTFQHCGELEPLLRAAANGLKPRGGLIIFLDALGDGPSSATFALDSQGRYSHSETYVKQQLGTAGLSMARMARDPSMRVHAQKPVAGLVVTAVKKQ